MAKLKQKEEDSRTSEIEQEIEDELVHVQNEKKETSKRLKEIQSIINKMKNKEEAIEL